MSYEVIARRWRPQDFTGLIGQDHIRTTLVNALKNNRLHHALLFTGPRGTGKTSTARILAKILRCPNKKDYVPCNTCSDCLEITSGRSVDVVEIDGASNNGVDAIRELRDTVGYLPSSGQIKMYIIDEVHMLSTSAFNALLKTLEEPPAHVYFVMATTEVHKIPATILSRCQRFDFRRIPTRVIAQHLQTICERDGVKFEPDALWTIARQGDGSMRDSQSLLDQVINFTAGDLRRDLVISTLGLTDRGLLQEMLAAIMAGDIQSLVPKLKDLHTSGGDPKLFLLEVMEQIRNALVLKLREDRSLVDLPDSEIEALVKMAAPLSQEDLHWLFDMALKGAQDLARASDPILVLEMVLMRMTTAPRVSFATRTAAAGHTPSPKMPQRKSATPIETAPTPGTPAHRFKELVEKIKEVNGLIGAQLENCFVAGFENKTINLGVASKHKFLFEKLNQPEFKKKVLNYMNSFWGPGHSLTITMTDPDNDKAASPKALAQKAEEEKRESTRRQVESHPLVRTTKKVFKTEIKSITDL